MKMFKENTELRFTRETLKELLQSVIDKRTFHEMKISGIEMYPKNKYCIRLILKGRNTKGDSNE